MVGLLERQQPLPWQEKTLLRSLVERLSALTLHLTIEVWVRGIANVLPTARLPATADVAAPSNEHRLPLL